MLMDVFLEAVFSRYIDGSPDAGLRDIQRPAVAVRFLGLAARGFAAPLCMMTRVGIALMSLRGFTKMITTLAQTRLVGAHPVMHPPPACRDDLDIPDLDQAGLRHAEQIAAGRLFKFVANR